MHETQITNSINPPERLLPWLVYNQFLTGKLESITGDARLDVLAQRWEMPDAWDQRILNLNTASVMHREILMWAFDTPCWYARTILPDTTFQANTTLFDRLKTESMGHLIFNGTEIKRASLTHYMVTPSSREYSWLNESMHQGESALWVRLSEFLVNSTQSPCLPREGGDPSLMWHGNDVENGSPPSRGRQLDQEHSFFLVEILLPGLLRYIS